MSDGIIRRQLRCDEAMAKHKSIKYLYHLQKESRPYRSREPLYGNCNHKCKDCFCAMYDIDMSNKLVGEHMPAENLKQGSASMSALMIGLERG